MDDMGSIHFASQKGHFEIVRILLSSGASVKAVNRKGFTPLHYAVQGSHCELIKYLVRKGASLAAKTKSGQTPLDLANSEEVRSCLVESEQSRKKGDEGAGGKEVEVPVAMQSDDEQKGPDVNEVSGKAEGEDEIGSAKREFEETNEEDLSQSKKARVSLDHLSAETDTVDADEE